MNTDTATEATTNDARTVLIILSIIAFWFVLKIGTEFIAHRLEMGRIERQAKNLREEHDRAMEIQKINRDEADAKFHRELELLLERRSMQNPCPSASIRGLTSSSTPPEPAE